MLEAKLKKSDEDLAKQIRQVEALRNVVKEKVDDEKKLKYQNQKLNEQVC